MRNCICKLAALFLSAALLLGTLPTRAAGHVDDFGQQGDELVQEVYDAAINFANVRNDKVFTWPSEGTVLVYTGATVTSTLKKSVERLDGMVIPAGLVVDFYYDCSVLNNPTFPHGYQFLAQYDTTDGQPDTVHAQELLYEFDQIFGTHLADSATTHGVPFRDFYDVRATDYFADAVSWALEENITNGSGVNTFSPDGTVTRAQAVTFLWRAAGSPAPSTTVSPFTDVADASQYYYKAVLWAVEQGIANGVGNNRFSPNSALAYDQFLAMLCRAAGGSTGSDWSTGAITWASQNHLTDGVTITAKGACPRRDVVYFLWKQSGTIQETPDQDRNMTLSEEEMLTALLVNSLMEQKSVIDVSGYYMNPDTLLALAHAVADIDGDNLYYVNSIQYTQAQDGHVLTLNIGYSLIFADGNSSYWITLNRETKEKVREIVAQTVTPGMTDFEIAKALHDYLVLHCAYDMRLYSGGMPSESYTASGALLDGTAVCAGYAKAYEALLTEAGIPCEYVTGYGNGGRHGWNIVQIDGEWYHVDTTWDDPTPNREGYVRYNYFLLSDSAMGRDHSGWNSEHRCTSTKYDTLGLPPVTDGETSGENGAGGAGVEITDDLDGLLSPTDNQEYRSKMAPIYEQLIAAGQGLSGQSAKIDISQYEYSYVLEALRKLNDHPDYGSRFLYGRYDSETVFVYDRTYAETTIQSYLQEVEQAVAQREDSFHTSERCTTEQLTLWFQVSDLLRQDGYHLGSFVSGEDFTVGTSYYGSTGDDADGWSYTIPLQYND